MRVTPMVSIGNHGVVQEAEPSGLARRGLRLVTDYAAMFPKLFAVAVAGAVTFSVATITSSWVLGRVVDRLIEPRFDTASLDNMSLNAATVAGLLGLVLVIGIARSLAVVVRRSFAARWQHGVEARLRDAVVDTYSAQSLAWLRRSSTGELMARAETDVEAAGAFLGPLPYAIGVLALLVVAPVWLVLIDVVLGWVAVALMPVLAALSVVYQRRMAVPAQRVQERLAELSAVTFESIDAVPLVKAMGAERVQAERFTASSRALRDARVAQLRLRSWFDAVLDEAPGLVNVALVVVGVARVDAGAVSIGQVVAVVSLYSMLVWPLRMIAYALSELPRSLAGRGRVDAVLSAPVETVPGPGRCGGETALEADGVCLVHDDGRVALDDVNVRVARGGFTAIVGATGSGKTSLLHVLAGIVAPSAGRVATMSASVVLVFQESFLFSGTVRENVDPVGDASTRAVTDALDVTQASLFVSRLPQCLDTVVGERGVTLSGGQRQRLALARGLVRAPDVLLLDDATSSLDTTTEAAVLSALALHERRSGGTPTVVAVATRPATIALADSVVFMAHGRVIDHGAHRDLLLAHEQYRALVDAYGRDRRSGIEHAATMNTRQP
jgi:ATP-binding cassette, subfamily B, bacterial